MAELENSLQIFMEEYSPAIPRIPEGSCGKTTEGTSRRICAEFTNGNSERMTQRIPELYMIS